jgi:conjugal transfer pilus assembly protein TraF
VLHRKIRKVLMMLQRSRISLAVLAALLAASTTLAIAADRNGDGVEVRQSEDTLYCKESEARHLVLLREAERGAAGCTPRSKPARDRLAAIRDAVSRN